MIRRYVVTAAVGAGALALAPAGAAVSAVSAVSAVDEPLTVTADREAAPAVEPGLHLLDLGRGGWLQVDRSDLAGTLWVGESVVSARADNGEFRVRVHDDDGDCSWAEDGWVGQEAVQVQLRAGGTATENCSGEAVWLQHDLTSSADYTDTPITLATWEEPAATARGLPGPSRHVAWDDSAVEGEATSLTPGVSYADAPVAEKGWHEVRVDPGAPALLAVDLDWGQHLQVELRIEEGHTFESPQVRPRLINPLGMTVPWANSLASESGTEPPSYPYLLVIRGQAYEGGTVSPTIRYRNREDDDNPAAFPGRYYVALDMEDEGRTSSDGAEFEVALKVIDDEEPVPPYEGPADLPDLATDLTAEEPEESTAPPSDEATTSASEGDRRPWPAAIGLLAGSLVCAVAGAVLLGRWRRGAVQ